MPANYLDRTGYRLPTEAEWEYACRGGTTTTRSHGTAAELSDTTAWYERNADERMHRGGLLKPNDFGLFDMHGNAWEWCQTTYSDVPKRPKDGEAVVDREEADDVLGLKMRVLRGGGFGSPTPNLRSASRMGAEPEKIENTFGFRVARTCK